MCLSTQVFPCLLTSDLPIGVVEVPQVSVEVQRRDGIVSGGLLLPRRPTSHQGCFSCVQNVVGSISECAINWSPTQHCTAKHVLDAVVDSAQGVEAGAFLKGEGLLKGWVSRRCGSLEEVG